MSATDGTLPHRPAGDPPTPAALMAELASPAGRALLARLPRYDEGQVLAVTSRLRGEGVPADLVSAALTQSRLRSRALPRLGEIATDLLLTADGLEQATRTVVAARHAERFRAAGVDHVRDLGCGLGLDALAMARAGLAVTAVERDAEVAVAARANLAPYPRARVVTGDAGDVEVGPEDGVWLDPARRVSGLADVQGRTRRLFRLADLSPGWDQVLTVAARARTTGVKLSPGFAARDLPAGAEAEWVSVDGDVVECAVWWGTAVRRPGISAVVGGRHGWVVVEPVEGAPAPLSPGEQTGPWLAEPDRAVLSAGLCGSLAAAVSGHELDEGVGYVTADRPVDLPWARWYEVEEVLPLHARTVRAWLRGRGAGRVTIKKRGVPTDPDQFRRELRLGRAGSSEEVVLVLTRVAGTPSALVVRPQTAVRP
ncbi:class I SAM-dependent methyltransferase [Ornithinimicrobium cerasi]|uniref:class I SAM-dependent methyltransferase n=1 Tax=Ornithinimicrobium cerasi TaxID=2248773 RepID=UPI001F3EB173|nr:class I SAM-dependent methyltransferase [Ornithinimicrobium cerasi]